MMPLPLAAVGCALRLPPPWAALGCALLLAGAPAVAMQFHAAGDTLVAAGPIDGNDMARLRDQLDGRSFRRLLLHDSPGGDLFNAYLMAHRIRSEGMDTAVSGKCESACALVFLAGRRRAYSDGRPLGATMVGLHGATHFQSGAPMPALNPRMAWVIRNWTGGKYPADLLQRTVYPRHPHDLVYAFHPLRYPPGTPPRGVMECLKQYDGSHRCTMLDGLDAIGIGIATEPDVLELEPAVKEVLQRLQ